VSDERHKVSKSVHLDLYLMFKNNTNCAKLRVCVNWFEIAVDIKLCLSERNWL